MEDNGYNISKDEYQSVKENDKKVRNAKVLFRRGGNDLPTEIVDGQILMNIETGKMYADFSSVGYSSVKEYAGGKPIPDILQSGGNDANADSRNKAFRKLICGQPFGVSHTSQDTPIKTVDIPGIPEYFNGLTVTVVFDAIDEDLPDNLSISIVDSLLGVTLQAIPIVKPGGAPITGADLIVNTPHQFVWYNDMFILMSNTLKPVEENIE